MVDVLGEPDAHDPVSINCYKQMLYLVALYKLEAVIFFRGRQSAREVRHSLKASDIFVAPSVELANGDKDGIPTALLGLGLRSYQHHRWLSS